MKRFTNVKSGGVILTLLLLALVSGSVWGQETYQRVTSVSELEAEKSFLIVNVDDHGCPPAGRSPAFAADTAPPRRQWHGTQGLPALRP